ncbi:phytase [Actinoplanes sp. NPDC049316]|uniref:phytase n=1 Tax=Actinoplanes sp. NPDC049316 TaxID=3154727 RepID=UPI00343208B0
MRRTAGIAALATLSTTVAAPAQAGRPAEDTREVIAAAETPALFDDAGGDADADDPAIRVDRADRARSRIIGTAKNGGLRVYDLSGREVQSITPPAGGRFNNVDLVSGLGGQDLAVVTDRGFGGRIRADAEGVTIYPTGRRSGYLIVSSQGDSRFFVYDRRTNRPVRSFRVVDGPYADGVQHSDGAAATAAALPGHPRGILVLHDGENTPDPGRAGTDFKIVDWHTLGLR